MRTTDESNQLNVSTKDLLTALLLNKTYVKLLNTNKKPYKPIVDWMISFRSDDEDVNIPAIGALAKMVGKDIKSLSIYIKRIYDDILTLNEEHPERFVEDGQILCELEFKCTFNHGFFNLGLNVMPTKGDVFQFHFLEPLFGRRLFHVIGFDHEIENGKHKIGISLSDEQYFQYFELLKEKFYFTGKITYEEFLGLKELSDKTKFRVHDICL
jgi:hypothetical protein